MRRVAWIKLMEGESELLDEYGNIATMLDVLESFVARLNRHCDVDPDMWSGIIRFLRHVVHGCHVAKVEALLNSLAARYDTAAQEDIDSLLRGRYGTARSLFSALADRNISQRDPTSLGETTESTQQYVDCLRQIIALERPIVETLLAYPLTPEEERLIAELKRLEFLHIGPTGREWYTQVVLDYSDIVSSWSGDLTGRVLA
jgi:hemerythrin-like domain-containing protein